MSQRKMLQRLANTLSPAGRRGRLTVFCYHQVLDIKDEFRAGEPTVDEFTADVDHIASMFNVLGFADAVAKLVSGTLPARAACITFDDGYENNHSLAAPVLEAAGVPATFFIAGGAVDDGVMWNDLVVQATIGAHGIPAIPDEYDFLIRPDSDLSSSELVLNLLQQLKYRPMAQRWEIACRLYRDNVSGELPRLMMTRDQVSDLSRRGFEIGGHTIKHPILMELPDEDARAEIGNCWQWVREVTGVAPKSFAYPNGRAQLDFDERHQAMVAEAGFDAAATTEWQVANAATAALSVPRVGPWWRQGRSLGYGLLRAYARSYF